MLWPGGVAGADGDKDVHTAASRVDEDGVHFDKFIDADGPVEVNVADGGDDAVAATPLCGGGVGSLIDPFEESAAVDEADDADISGLDTEEVDCRVAARLWWAGRLGALGQIFTRRLLCRLHFDGPPLAWLQPMM